MKFRNLRSMSILLGLLVLSLSGCIKQAVTTAQDDSVSAQDATTISSAVGSTTDDAACAAGQVADYKSIQLNNGGGNIFIGASIADTLASDSGGITINYSGSVYCNGISRSGSITITKGNSLPWDSIGAQLLVTINLAITDSVSDSTYHISGTETITNVYGGLAWKVLAGQSSTPVSHKYSGNLTITYANQTTSIWSINRIRGYSYVPGAGNTFTFSGVPGIAAESGTNRFGSQFSTTISQPVIADNYCGMRPYTGTVSHVVSNRTATIQFGTTSSGSTAGSNAQNCNNGCYITYTNGLITLHRFVPYW